MERMMQTKRRVAFKAPVVVDDAGEQYGSDSDSETESITTVGRAERLARNKPRALLKKGKLNARKKDVEAPVAASNPLHLLDSDSDALAEGDEDEDDEGVAAAARRASMFDVLDAEVVDDGAGATPALASRLSASSCALRCARPSDACAARCPTRTSSCTAGT